MITNCILSIINLFLASLEYSWIGFYISSFSSFTVKICMVSDFLLVLYWTLCWILVVKIKYDTNLGLPSSLLLFGLNRFLTVKFSELSSDILPFVALRTENSKEVRDSTWCKLHIYKTSFRRTKRIRFKVILSYILWAHYIYQGFLLHFRKYYTNTTLMCL